MLISVTPCEMVALTWLSFEFLLKTHVQGSRENKERLQLNDIEVFPLSICYHGLTEQSLGQQKAQIL